MIINLKFHMNDELFLKFVLISSNVNEVIRTILSQFLLLLLLLLLLFFVLLLFFYKKILHAQKHSQAKTNYRHKSKLKNKRNNFLHVQTSKRVKLAEYRL